MFNVSALMLDDALWKCVVTEVVLFSVVARVVPNSGFLLFGRIQIHYSDHYSAPKRYSVHP